MRKVLIPTDFSDGAMNAVSYAFDMFKGMGDTEFILLNTYDIPRSGLSNIKLKSINDILKKDSEEGLERCLAKMKKNGDANHVRIISKHGMLSDVIEGLLLTEDYNLIVMGTVGAGGLKKVLLGSNTSDVVKRIKKPILIVPHKAKFVIPDKILFTTDFKPISRELQMERLRDFASRMNSEILVLNVHEENKRVNIDKAKVSSGIEDLLKGMKHSYYDTIGDDIIEGIDDFVIKHDIKIIAMIVRHLNFVESIFHKSLTREMAMHTHIPMLALYD